MKILSNNFCACLYIFYLSISDARIVVAMDDGWASFSLNTLSITDNSVDVVSRPQKEHQSLTTIPAAITSDPRFTVPAYKKSFRFN